MWEARSETTEKEDTSCMKGFRPDCVSTSAGTNGKFQLKDHCRLALGHPLQVHTPAWPGREPTGIDCQLIILSVAC